MTYNEIKSNYVKDKLKKTSWKDKSYIDDLIRLEDIIATGPGGMAGAMLYSSLIDKYREEWESIYREINPEKAEEVIGRKKEREEKMMKEREDLKKRQKKELEDKLKNWLEAGGKP